MRNYILYPEAERKLDAIGIPERFKTIDHPFFGGYFSEDDALELLQDVKESELLSLVAEDKRNKLVEGLQSLLEGRNEHWRIQEADVETSVEFNPEHVLILSGEYAAQLLKPEEVVDHRNIGFSSLSELFGTVGAFFFENSRLNLEKGYSWTRRHADGKIIISGVGENMHGDLSLGQINTTPYETLDPLGSSVHYRPVRKEDRSIVSGAHSVEQKLLSYLIKYFDQNQISLELLRDIVRPIITNTQQNPFGIKYAEQVFSNEPDPYLLLFHDYPIPKLEEYDSNKHGPYFLPSNMNEGYDLVIGPNKELLFVSPNKSKVNINARFLPEDVPLLALALFNNASQGIGRTNLGTLIKTLDYRMSEQFERDQKDLRKL